MSWLDAGANCISRQLRSRKWITGSLGFFQRKEFWRKVTLRVGNIVLCERTRVPHRVIDSPPYFGGNPASLNDGLPGYGRKLCSLQLKNKLLKDVNKLITNHILYRERFTFWRSGS